MNLRYELLGTCLVICLAAACCGCDDGRPERVPASGVVMVDRQPLTLGMVTVIPEGQRPSIGAIGPDGRFELTCYEKGDGVVPGTHRATVTAAESLTERSNRWHAPKKYTDASTSGLKVTIEEPTDDLKIDLTWNGGKPFVENF